VDQTTAAKTMRMRDGRRLCYEEFGDPDGAPVILMHGSPGSRLSPHPRTSRLHLAGVRVIAYDRPGYGDSERQTGRCIADAAADMEDLANELGIELFAVAGRSGGAPHALACAALLPERVTRAAALVAVAPRALMGEQWYRDMSARNVDWYRMAERGLGPYTAYVAEEMNRSRADPDTFVPYEHPGLPRADKKVVSDFGIRELFSENFSEGLRWSVDGWIDDNIAIVNPWGFDPARITVPVLLWHGTEDIFSPVDHSRWLAMEIPQAELRLVEGSAHFSAVEVLPSVLKWLTEET